MYGVEHETWHDFNPSHRKKSLPLLAIEARAERAWQRVSDLVDAGAPPENIQAALEEARHLQDILERDLAEWHARIHTPTSLDLQAEEDRREWAHFTQQLRHGG